MTIIIPAVLLTTHCTHGRAWHTVTPPGAVNRARPSTAGHAPAPPPDRDLVDTAQLEAQLCEEGESCCFGGVARVGTDANAELVVVTMRHGSCEPPANPVESSGGFCEDYYLVSLGVGDRAARWFGRECGDRGQEVTTSVDPASGSFTYSYSARIATGRVAGSVSFGLDPLRLAATSSTSWSTNDSRDVQWDWQTFSGSLDVGLDYCPGKGPPDATAALPDAHPVVVSAIPIPRVTLPTAFVHDGWRTIGLGDCAARIDGAGSGFSSEGAAGTAQDAMFRAVLSDSNELFIEVEDDHLVGGGNGVMKSDHLQIWTAASKECVDPTAPSSATEWNIRMVDGRVFPGFGRPTQPPSVERVRGDRRVRMKIGLARALDANDRVTVAYSDSDDGVQAKRRIGTSQLVPGKWWTLGTSYDPFADPLVELKLRRPDVGCEITSTKLSARSPVIPSTPE